jgi:hypothetical protein
MRSVPGGQSSETFGRRLGFKADEGMWISFSGAKFAAAVSLAHDSDRDQLHKM